MTQASIFHLEPSDRFTRRVVDLNRLYNPEDALHDALTGGPPNGAPGAGREDVAAARKKLATIHKEFPYGAPLHEQAAYVVRAFTGLAVFGEANFRTGWDYLAGLLEHQGHPLLASDQEGRALGLEAWQRLQADHPGGFSRRAVLQRDATFEMLADWFRQRIG